MLAGRFEAPATSESEVLQVYGQTRLESLVVHEDSFVHGFLDLRRKVRGFLGEDSSVISKQLIRVLVSHLHYRTTSLAHDRF